MNELSDEARKIRAEYYRTYSKNNREKCNEANRKYRANHPEKVREYNRRYWEKRANNQQSEERSE